MASESRRSRVGRVTSGRYSGMYVNVEQDESGAGFHIWLSQAHPDVGPSHGWDAWADDEAGVDKWFSGELSSVEWDE